MSYTLNTIDRHAVCFQLCGDRENPSVSTSDKAYCIPANPMSDRGQAVCFQQNQREEVRNMGETAGCLNADSGMHNTNYVCFRKVSKPGADGKGERWEESEITNTLNGFEFHSDVRTPEIVCSTVDCRNLTLNREISGTLQCKSEGGYSLNYQNPVIYDARGNGQGGIAYADGRSSEPGHGLHVAGCFQETGFGWFRESAVAETLRTPAGGGSYIANLVSFERRTS